MALEQAETCRSFPGTRYCYRLTGDQENTPVDDRQGWKIGYKLTPCFRVGEGELAVKEPWAPLPRLRAGFRLKDQSASPTRNEKRAAKSDGGDFGL